MTICIYIPTASFFVGGGEIVPLNQAQYLSKRGHDVTVLVLKTNKETEFFKKLKKEASNVKVKYLHLNNDILGNIEQKDLTHKLGHQLYFALSRQVADIFTKNRFDAAITHYAPAAFSIPKSTKQFLYLHGVPSKKQPVNNTAVKTTDKLIAVSNSVARGWKEMFNIQKEIQIIHNGIDQNKFKPKPQKKKTIDIFYIGRLIKIKGVQHLLEAISYINKPEREKLKVAIGGKGPYKNALEKIVNKYKLDNVVKFKGYISDSNLIDYYNKSKIVIFPSYAKEGVLTTLLEAASMENAIITANCCGMVEFINDKKNGLLFEPKNSKDLKNKIQLLLNDRNMRTRLGKAAREKIVKSWTWDHSVSKLENFIQTSLR